MNRLEKLAKKELNETQRLFRNADFVLEEVENDMRKTAKLMKVIEEMNQMWDRMTFVTKMSSKDKAELEDEFCSSFSFLFIIL